MNKEQFTILVDNYITGSITENERAQLAEMLDDPQYATLLDEHLKMIFDESVDYHDDAITRERVKALVIEKINNGQYSLAESGSHRVHFLKTAWFKYAAAILLITGVSTYLWNSTQKESKKTTSSAEARSAKEDILPGSNRAILTLSDGKNIELDSTGKLIYGADGRLSPFEKGGRRYLPGDLTAGGFNTMSTPKGGQYQLTLSDGTRVWLNAASSITYPTSFTNKTREVSISGEAYFEVKSIKEKPFIVHLSPAGESGGANRDRELNKNRRDDEGGLDITVLGTSFNVNTYTDEKSSKTSLVEGSIKINNTILKPGEAYSTGKLIKTNIEQDIAWKNGLFDFNNVELPDAMRQIARWYDLQIKFEGPVSKSLLFGKIDRKLTLQGLLKGMEGEIAHFRLEGKVLYIRSL